MKKIFLLLFSVTMLAACGSDDPVIPDPTPVNPTIPTTEWNGNWNDSKDPNYKKEGYNPIAGDWIVTKRNGATVSDFMVYRFMQTYPPYLLIATTKPAKGKAPTYGGNQSYQINDKAYKINNTIYKYTLVNLTSLTIVDGSTTISLIPYNNNDVWYWKGDWNNPADPHYAIYKGKYNPIVGTWKKISENGIGEPGNLQTRFNDDFTVEETYDPETKHKYQINDIGIREDSFKYGSVTYPSDTWHYWIEGNTLYLQGTYNGDFSNLSIYTRVE